MKTLEEIEACGKPMLIPSDIAAGVNAELFRLISGYRLPFCVQTDGQILLTPALFKPELPDPIHKTAPSHVYKKYTTRALAFQQMHQISANYCKPY